MQPVWIKRHFRVYDHAALAEAAAQGPVSPLGIATPEYESQPDAAGRHRAFIAECLGELRKDLAASKRRRSPTPNLQPMVEALRATDADPIGAAADTPFPGGLVGDRHYCSDAIRRTP